MEHTLCVCVYVLPVDTVFTVLFLRLLLLSLALLTVSSALSLSCLIAFFAGVAANFCLLVFPFFIFSAQHSHYCLVKFSPGKWKRDTSHFLCLFWQLLHKKSLWRRMSHWNQTQVVIYVLSPQVHYHYHYSQSVLVLGSFHDVCSLFGSPPHSLLPSSPACLTLLNSELWH